ncbi:MAG: ABC transporter permease, partial [Planctomycetota bacterium]
MRFSALIVKNLVRRPHRSLLTLCALATAIAAVVALTAIADGFTHSFTAVYEAHSVDLVVSRQGAEDRLSSSVDAQLAERIERIPGVARAAPVLLEMLSIEDAGVYGVPTLGIELDSWLMEDYEIVAAADQNATPRSQSDGAAATEPRPDRIVYLGIHLAQRIGVQAGDTVRIFDDPYTVKGIFRSPSTWENGSMILPLATLQALTDRPGGATYIDVVLHKPISEKELQRIIAAIEALDNRLLALPTEEFVDTDLRMKMARAMAWLTGTIALFIGGLGTLNTMLMSVMERTREIGILRAIGWPRRRVVGMILGESCTLALAAAGLGVVVAWAMLGVLERSPAVQGLIDPYFGLSALVRGFVLAIGIGWIGA